MHKYFFSVLTGILLFFLSQCRSPKQLDEYYCNVMAGEPSQTSVILVARLHKTDTLVNNDLQGINGFIKFRITRDPQTKSFMESSFFEANAENDFTAKYEFTGLRPGQKYFYSISYGRDTSNNTSSRWNTFKTINLPVSDKNISFVVTNGFNYQTIQSSDKKGNFHPEKSGSLFSRYPVFNSITAFKPDFWIGNGEIRTSNNSPEKIHEEWHNLFSLTGFNTMVSNIPSYWILSENTINENSVFDEIPVNTDSKSNNSYCRTYRLNRDVQIWMLNNQYFNNNESGITSQRATRLEWLKTTLNESDSPFKLLISGPAVIGPDNSINAESQNYSEVLNLAKDSLFAWLRNNGFRNNGLYFICNKPDLQFHSINSMGFEEFSCGAMFNPEVPLAPAITDSLSGVMNASIVQPFHQYNPSGGFLLVNSNRDEFNSPVLLFRFFDGEKKLLYAINKY